MKQIFIVEQIQWKLITKISINSKTLFLAHFPNFWGRNSFSENPGSATHNFIWVSSTIPKFGKKLMIQFQDPFYRTFQTTTGGLKTRKELGMTSYTAVKWQKEAILRNFNIFFAGETSCMLLHKLKLSLGFYFWVITLLKGSKF